jgi:hypothetical protein
MDSSACLKSLSDVWPAIQRSIASLGLNIAKKHFYERKIHVFCFDSSHKLRELLSFPRFFSKAMALVGRSSLLTESGFETFLNVARGAGKKSDKPPLHKTAKSGFCCVSRLRKGELRNESSLRRCPLGE